MKLLLPFALSAFIPGLGQLYIAKYWKGTLLFIAPILSFFLFPVGFIYTYYVGIIISLVDLYITFEKVEDKRKVINNLIFGIVTVVIIIPAIFYLFTLSVYKGGLYVKNEFLSENFTKSEMEEIIKALNRYQTDTDTFPSDFASFVSSKPIWDSWYTDHWGNSYKYVKEGEYVKLISAGKDRTFDTDDDITLSSSFK